MELSDVITALRRYFLLIVGIGVLAAAGAFATLPKPDYQATATIQLLPEGGAANLSDQAVSLLMPGIVTRMTSSAFDDAVTLSLPSAVASVPATVTEDGNTLTDLLTITATSRDASVVAAWANGYAAYLLANPGSIRGYAVMRSVAHAVTPSEPRSRHEKVVLIGAALAGVMVGIILALALRALGIQRADPDRRARRYGAPLLAEIPHVRRSGPGPLLVDTEAIQALQVEVVLARRMAPFNTLAVLSDRPGEGRSSVVSALGTALHRSGIDVVLVDADPRHPTLALDTRGPVAGPRVRNTIRTPPCVSLGHDDGLPAELVVGSLPGMLAELTATHDLVLIDGPSFADKPAAEAVAALAGTVVLVVRSSRLASGQVRRTLELIKARKATVTGVVANRPRRRTHGVSSPAGTPPTADPKLSSEVKPNESVASATLSRSELRRVRNSKSEAAEGAR